MGIYVQTFQPTFKACRSLLSDYESEGEAGSNFGHRLVVLMDLCVHTIFYARHL